MKTVEREQARLLRRVDGLPVKEIARRLGVARSTVSLWVRDIELTAEQHALLLARNPAYNRQRNGAQANADRALARRRAYQTEGRALACRGDRTYAAGCMLFWAEGSRLTHSVQLTNSDPELMRFFARFLRTFFEVPDERFRVECHVFADHLERVRELEDFWLDVLALPRSALTKTQVNRFSKWSKKRRTNALPYGTCRLTLHDTRVVQVLYGSIQELAGFAREDWSRR